MRDRDSKGLSNKYWQDMEALLDKELPVKRSKRRLPFIFLWGIAGTFLVIFSIFFLRKGEANEENPLLLTPKTEQTEKRIKIANVKNEGQSNVKDLVSNTFHDETYRQKESINTRRKHGLKTDGTSIENRVDVALKSKIQNNDIINATSVNQSLNFGENLILSTDSEAKEIRQEFVVGPVESIMPNMFTINHSNLNPKPINLVSNERLAKFGLEASAVTHNLQTVGQYKIGVFSQFPILSGLYGVASVQYSQFNKNLAFTQKILSNETIDRSILENIFTTPQSGSTANNSAQSLQELDLVSDVTNKLHYAKLQLGIGYKLHQKWSVESSVHYYRLISAKYKTNPMLNESLTTLGFMPLDQNTLDTKEGVHKKSLFAFGFDVQYTINHHFTIGIEGNWWPTFNTQSQDVSRSSTSLDANGKFLSTINNQHTSLSTGLKIRYIW